MSESINEGQEWEIEISESGMLGYASACADVYSGVEVVFDGEAIADCSVRYFRRKAYINDHKGDADVEAQNLLAHIKKDLDGESAGSLSICGDGKMSMDIEITTQKDVRISSDKIGEKHDLLIAGKDRIVGAVITNLSRHVDEQNNAVSKMEFDLLGASFEVIES